MKYDSFFLSMEKKAGFWEGAGRAMGRIANAPTGAIVGGLAALYFAPTIINTLMGIRQAGGIDESAQSLKNLELANQRMVQSMQQMQPAAGPRKDSYPYV